MASCAQRPLLLLMITMMSVLGLIASDIFLPAIPEIIDHYGITKNQAQSLFSYFLFGIAIMNLIYGPLSDCLGRRPLLLAGILIFTLTSFAIPYTATFEQALMLRILQAIGACAGLTLGRAIIGDMYKKEEASKVFLTVFPIVGMCPAIAPMIGGQLTDTWGWQASFIFSMLFGAILIGLVLWRLPETLPVSQRLSLKPSNISEAYTTLLRHRGFWYYAIPSCFAYSVYFAYIAESPFLLQQQGVPQALVGYAYISLSTAYVFGNLAARALMNRGFSSDRLIRIACHLFLFGGIFLATATHIMPQDFFPSILCISIITFSNGILLPLGAGGVIMCIPKLAGSASGLLGCLQIGSAAFAAHFIGELSQHEPGRFGMAILLIIIVGFILFKYFSTLKQSAENLASKRA